MVAVMAPESVTDGVRRLAARGVPAWVCGHVRAATEHDRSDSPAKGGVGGTVTLVGEHP
jgi:phosphoribosylformylglycinamidine cyclo-ligase